MAWPNSGVRLVVDNTSASVIGTSNDSCLSLIYILNTYTKFITYGQTYKFDEAGSKLYIIYDVLLWQNDINIADDELAAKETS